MINEEIYKSINTKEAVKQNSIMGIIPRPIDKDWMDMKRVAKQLDNYPEFKLIGIKKATEDFNSDHILGDFAYDALICYKESEHLIRITAYTTKRIDFSTLAFGDHILAEDIQEALHQPYYLETDCIFSEYPLLSYHFQLKVLAALVPHASLMIDFSLQLASSTSWLQWVASSSIEPSIDYLFKINTTYKKISEEKTEYWFKTAGLKRCGSVELKILNFTEYPQEMFQLILASAREFIVNPQGENAVFHVGKHINLCWIRWEEAFMLISPSILGGLKDREQAQDSFYLKEPSGILFAVQDGNLHSPQIYGTTLQGDNALYDMPSEEHRIQKTAGERLPFFLQVFDTWQKNFSDLDEQEWGFFLLLAIPVEEKQEENLWVQVIQISTEKITGEIMTSSSFSNNLGKGSRITLPINENIKDWIIYAPDGEYTPDTAYLLESTSDLSKDIESNS